MTENNVNPPINNDPMEKRNEFIDHPSYVAQTVTVSDKIETRYKTFISLSPYIRGYMRKQNAVIILKSDYRDITKVCIQAFLK